MEKIKCPACGAKNVVKICYGLPTYETFLEAQAGKIKLGGCIVEENSPEYFCKDCEHEWKKGKLTLGA